MKSKYKYLVYFLALVLVVYGLSSIFYQQFYLVETEHRGLSGAVIYGQPNIWYDPNATVISFGSMPGSMGTKLPFFVKNDFSFPVKVEFEADGQMGNKFGVSENNFVLGPGESRKITMTFDRAGLLVGDYTSHLTITKKRVFR